MKCSMPAARASSTTCWISGRSTTGSISFGIALVAGRKRVPRPATGKMALRMGFIGSDLGNWRLIGLAIGAAVTRVAMWGTIVVRESRHETHHGGTFGNRMPRILIRLDALTFRQPNSSANRSVLIVWGRSIRGFARENSDDRLEIVGWDDVRGRRLGRRDRRYDGADDRTAVPVPGAGLAHCDRFGSESEGLRCARMERAIRRFRPSAHDRGGDPCGRGEFQRLLGRLVAGCRTTRRCARNFRYSNTRPHPRSAHHGPDGSTAGIHQGSLGLSRRAGE